MQNSEVIEYIKQAFELKSQKCYKQAIEMLYKALEIENDNIEILFQLGELYFMLKNFSRSCHYLEKVLLKDNRHIETLRILGKIYFYNNDSDNAYKTAETIYNITKNTEDLLEFINILSKAKDIDKIEKLEKQIELDDKICYGLAKAYYDNNKLEKAKEKLQCALNLNPENESALVLLGKIYFDESKFEKSREIFEGFSKNTENPEILNYLGLFAIEDMHFIDAIKYFAKASNIDKENPKYFYNLGNAYFYNGWFKESAQAYLKAICMLPDEPGFRYSLAYLYYTQKNFDKAQREIDYILKENPKYSLAVVLDALLKLEKKDFLGAKNELEENLKDGNDDNFTLVSLAKVYKELDLFEKAESAITKVLDRTPESLNYRCLLAEIYISEKKYDDAMRLLENIIAKHENYILAYALAAETSYKINNLELTKDFAQKMINLDMNYAEGYFYLALVRIEEEDYDEAIECMKRAIMYDIDNACYYAKMSEIYKLKGDYKTAIEYIKEAENISGNTEYKIMLSDLATLNRKTNNLTSKKI